MRPGLLLDKSAFQALGALEHALAQELFTVGIPPLLLYEVLADLSKYQHDAAGERKVAELASKFGGSGPPPMVDYGDAIVRSLLGNDPPTDGRLLLVGGRRSTNAHGEPGVVFDPTPVNMAIFRWRSGEFHQVEREFARLWRRELSELSHTGFRRVLDEENIQLGRANTRDQAFAIAAKELAAPTLQATWVRWLLDALKPDTQVRRAVLERWEREAVSLSEFAPYAASCVRTMLFFDLLTRWKLIPQRGTNLIDLRYLFYLPLCRVFVSGDKMHLAMAPYIAPPGRFFSLEEFRSDLAGILAHREGREHFLLPDALTMLHEHYLATPRSAIAGILRDWGWDPHRIPESSMTREAAEEFLRSRHPELFRRE